MLKNNQSITKKEYFAGLCSPAATIRNRIVTILAIICLAVQCFLCVRTVYALNKLYTIFRQHGFRIHGDGIEIGILIFSLLISLLFTIFAIKTKRTGLWITLAIFASLGLTRNVFLYYGWPWNIIALCVSLVVYLSFVVMNYLNNKEYKNYLQSNISDK